MNKHFTFTCRNKNDRNEKKKSKKKINVFRPFFLYFFSLGTEMTNAKKANYKLIRFLHSLNILKNHLFFFASVIQKLTY